MTRFNRAGLCLASMGALAVTAICGQAQATENAASLYLLGSGGPGTAVMPPF